MPDLVPEARLGRLSGTGWAVGYVGGLVSLLLMIGFLVGDPVTGTTILGTAPAFGLDPGRFEGDRASGLFTAAWYLVFVVPLFLFTPDVPRRMSVAAALRPGLRELAATLRGLRRDANAARYLIANMIYTDGMVALTVFGAIYAQSVYGWTEEYCRVSYLN
jgi:UMF1 family MFS transporter